LKLGDSEKSTLQAEVPGHGRFNWFHSGASIKSIFFLGDKEIQEDSQLP